MKIITIYDNKLKYTNSIKIQYGVSMYKKKIYWYKKT